MSIPQQRLYFRRLQLTDEKLRWLWEQCVRLKNRTMHEGATPEALMVTLAATNSLHFDVVDMATQQIIGIASLRDITPWSASAHATYFDGRLRGREAATKAMLVAMMKELDLQVIHCFTPETHRATIAFAKRLGFEQTGVIPRAIRRDGICLDHVVLSMVRETVEHPALVDAGGNGATNGELRRRWRREPHDQQTDADHLAPSAGDSGHPVPLRDGLDESRPSRLRQFLSRWWTPTAVSADRAQ